MKTTYLKSNGDGGMSFVKGFVDEDEKFYPCTVVSLVFRTASMVIETFPPEKKTRWDTSHWEGCHGDDFKDFLNRAMLMNSEQNKE